MPENELHKPKPEPSVQSSLQVISVLLTIAQIASVLTLMLPVLFNKVIAGLLVGCAYSIGFFLTFLFRSHYFDATLGKETEVTEQRRSMSNLCLAVMPFSASAAVLIAANAEFFNISGPFVFGSLDYTIAMGVAGTVLLASFLLSIYVGHVPGGVFSKTVEPEPVSASPAVGPPAARLKILSAESKHSPPAQSSNLIELLENIKDSGATAIRYKSDRADRGPYIEIDTQERLSIDQQILTECGLKRPMLEYDGRYYLESREVTPKDGGASLKAACEAVQPVVSTPSPASSMAAVGMHKQPTSTPVSVDTVTMEPVAPPNPMDKPQ